MNMKFIGIVLGILFEIIIYKIFFYSESLYPYLLAILLPLVVFIALRKIWNQFAKGFMIGGYSAIALVIIWAFFGAASLFKMI